MTGSVTILLKDFRRGNEEAAADLLNLFLPKMRKHLGSRASQLKVHDEDDIAVNAFYKFCDAIKKSRLQDISDRAELWHVLCRIAIREANDLRKYESAQFRGGDSETVSLSNLRMPLASIEKRPDVQLEMVEQCDQFLELLDDPRLKSVAELKLGGYTNQEIATQLKVSVRTVNYLIKTLKSRMLHLIDRRAA